MIHKLNPLGDAGLLCDTLMNRYPNPLDQPPAHRWHYHQGVFLLGVLRLGQTIGESSYISYVDQWIGELVGEDGSVDYTAGELDALQPANLLFHRLDDDSDGRYRRALDQLMGVLDDFPRTDQGGFWHKLKYPNQQWLDGLYMIGPLSARYSHLTGDSRWIDDAVTQAFLIADGTRDEKTGLLRHGFDRSRSAAWVRNGDMRAPESWGRALGWFPAALLDILDWMPDGHSKRERVENLFLDLMDNILRYRDPDSGLWYQVLDKGDDPRNWIETSCSSLFLYAMAKGRMMGLFDASIDRLIAETYRSLTTKTRRSTDGWFLVDDICIGTGIGDYRFYLDRPRSTNDLHGAGAYILAALEVHRVFHLGQIS